MRLNQTGRPIERYSVVLLAQIDDTWETIRVYDSGRNRPSQGPPGRDSGVMEELAKSKNTPGTDAAFDLLSRVAVDAGADQRFPDGTVLIPADSPDASALMSRAIEKRKPIAIVFPDGSDVLARPPAAHGEWVTEFHAAGSTADPQFVA